jgi:hypothetical protein
MAGMETIRGPGGQVVGFVHQLGKDQRQILNANQRLVGREVAGSTFDKSGRFVGKGNQGIRLLGSK